MSDTLKSLRALADPTRLRLLALIQREELSVNELQEITRLGQSRISTHLGLLSDAGLTVSRRDGKRIFYRLVNENDELLKLAIRGAKETGEYSRGTLRPLLRAGPLLASVRPAPPARHAAASHRRSRLRRRIAFRAPRAARKENNRGR
jgi:DNA-binding transcriptional ArsR family regulator